MVTKKDRERRLLRVFLRSLGEDPDQWIIAEERERPDFLLRSPQDDPIGVEVTELLKRGHGELRAAEGRLCRAIEEVVGEFIRRLGAPGAYIDGNNSTIARPRELRVDELRDSLRQHLDEHGQGLGAPNGSMEVPFEHDWGTVARIDRIENDTGVCSWLDWPDHAPEYKRGMLVEEIEACLLSIIDAKVRKANGYSDEWPVWLAVRNPNERIGQLSEHCLREAQRLNEGRFARVIMFNDPADVLDARPPAPYYVEVC